MKPKDMRNIPADKVEDIMFEECGYHDMIEVVKSFNIMKELQEGLDDKVLRNCFRTNDRELIKAKIEKIE